MTARTKSAKPAAKASAKAAASPSYPGPSAANPSPGHVRIGVIGLGGMGSHHADNLLAKRVPRCDLIAVCDIDAERMAKYATVRTFTDSAQLIRSGLVDAVIVATPHYSHTTIGADALSQGLHVLTEKPISVHKADCEKLIEAYKKRPKKSQQFAAMFQARTEPAWIRLRQLIRSGELGEIRRISWIVTDWFRTEAYYASGGWRATWKGEGGGVLINQCPHNLDLMQWLFGMPSRVRGFCGLGKWHAIETEDAVTAYLEYPNGATGTFITTTGEAPGTNRLEIAAELGRVVLESGKISWQRNTVPMTEFSRTTASRFDRPETWNVEIPTPGQSTYHLAIIHNFVDAILDGKPLIAEASEGINSVELGNAMLLSSILDRTLALPLDSAMVEREFKKLIKGSRARQGSAAGRTGGRRHGPLLPAGALSMRTDQIAAQLYTVRDHCADEAGLAASCARVRAIGYQAVQVSGVGPIPAARVKAILADHGLACCATHEAGKEIVEEPAKVVDRLGALGCSATAYPWPHLPLEDEAQVGALAQALDAAGATMARAGIALCYHNHAVEFRKIGPPGKRRTVLESIYAGTSARNLQGEIDTYWVQAGGGDPVAWCRRLSGRLPLLHLKDLGVRAGNEATTMEIGAGCLDWGAIIAAARAAGCRWYIVEQDTCPGDPFDSLAISWRYLAALAQG